MLLEFAAKAKKRKCKAGYPCGRSCISRNYFCLKPLTGQGKSWADWLRKNGRIREKPKKEKATKKSSILDRSLTRDERSQPDKLIEVGKAFGAKYAIEQIDKKIATYEKAKTSHYEKEKARTDQILPERNALQRKISELDSRAWALSAASRTKEAIEATEEADKLQEQLRSPKYDTRTKPFDRYDEIKREIASLASDKYLFRTKKDKQEYKKAIEERDRQKAKLEAERDRELKKLPGYKELNDLLSGISSNSPIAPDKAKEVLKDAVKFQTSAYKGIQFGTGYKISYSKLGTKKDIAAMKDDLTDIIQLSGQPPKRLSVAKVTGKTRAFAQHQGRNIDGKWEHEGSLINTGNSYTNNFKLPGKEVMYHEFGHTLEYQNQEIAEANITWIKSRATSDRPVQLKKLVPNGNYESNEIAYPDDFIDPYAGKTYAEEKRYKATEVFTMGVQHFTNPANMKKLYEKDKEHFYLTVGTIIAIQDKYRNNAN